jgi:2'-5' RNA ligase
VTAVGRAFVAVVPSGEALDAVDALIAPLHDRIPGARWTTRDQWHVTLQFLGNRVDLDAVAGALGALAVTRGVARIGQGGAFPTERRGRVLWVGLIEGAELVTQLAAAVGALLQPLGHEPEQRPHHAHLTLARLKTPTDLREPVVALGTDAVGPGWPVEEVVLYESRLRRTGAEYTAFARVPLAPG